MEPLMGDFISTGDWDFISTLLSNNEQTDFTSDALNGFVFEDGHNHGLDYEIPSGFFANPVGAYYREMGGIDNVNTHLHCAYQESSYSSNCDSNFYFPDVPIQSYDHNINQMILASNRDNSMSINDSFMEEQIGAKHFVPEFANIGMEDIVSLSDNMSNEKTGDPCDDSAKELQLKREFSSSDMSAGVEDDTNVDSSENPRKKTRASKNPRKSKKNVEPKKTRNQKAKCVSNDGEEVNEGADKQSCSNSNIEGDCSSNPDGGQGQVTTALNSVGKTRASRGAATDPQSLYARKRRERINERLKILQNLVPNGTKVDISTMLEEAVHYVKFLQLQIKLLSSDELWMYAPIAYNGLDIGLNQITFNPTMSHDH